VAISDLITLVRIALGEATPSDCPNGVPSTGGVDVAALVLAVGNATERLRGRLMRSAAAHRRG
jgi:hypothetical protein